jgi:esterase/lipase superfamily enzyme
MDPIRVYFATNRNVVGPEDAPTGFGPNFSPKGLQDLRFGQAMVQDGKIVELTCLPDTPNDGSAALFTEVKTKMSQQGRDTLIMVHGYNTTFEAAIVGAAKTKVAYKDANLNVFMFSWPSDGKYGPLVPQEYKDDRHDAMASGAAFCRGMLKLGAFLKEGAPCGQKVYLLTHSMGNYVLRNALQALIAQSTGPRLPRAFDAIFSMAADEDNDALDKPEKWERLPELTSQLLIYCNKRDKALLGSEDTKGNPDRMGNHGPAKPGNLPAKVTVIDVTKVNPLLGLGHSYYDEVPEVIADVLQVMAGLQGENVKGRNWVPAEHKYCIG